MSVKSRLRQWLSDESDAGVSPPGPEDDFWYHPVTRTGRYLSPETALAIDAVYACCDRLASTISSLPFQVYERLRNGGKRVAYDHPLYYVIHDSPNEELSAVEFWYAQVLQVELWGNAISRQVTSARNDVIELQMLMPWRVEVKRSPEGVRYYIHHLDNGDREILFDGDVLHIAGPGYDGLNGYSPIELHRRTFGAADHAEDYTSRFLANNGIPPAYISFPTALSPKSYSTLREWLLKILNRVHAGQPQVLDRGMEIKTVPINHRDLQYIELRGFQVEQICRIYNMPPHRVQKLDRSTNNNIEHQDIEYTKHTIIPRCRRIESRVNKSLLGIREGQTYFVEFNLDALYRGDMLSRAQAFGQMINTAQLMPNEARALENRNPVKGGNELYIQSGTVPLSQMLNPPEPPAAPQPQQPQAEEETDTEQEAADETAA